MTATERLRELLDEHGVKYDTHGERYGTWYDTPLGGHVYVPENNAGYLHVRSDAMTPEQAIAATLGRGAEPQRKRDADVRCPKCGDRLVAGANFCQNCGVNLWQS